MPRNSFKLKCRWKGSPTSVQKNPENLNSRNFFILRVCTFPGGTSNNKFVMVGKKSPVLTPSRCKSQALLLCDCDEPETLNWAVTCNGPSSQTNLRYHKKAEARSKVY